MVSIDWTRVHDDILTGMEKNFAELRECTENFNNAVNESVTAFCKEITKITEGKEERTMKIEVTENQLSMILDGLLAYSESIWNDLHALSAMKGTRFEFDGTEEEIKEIIKSLNDVRGFRTHLTNIYNGEEEEKE